MNAKEMFDSLARGAIKRAGLESLLDNLSKSDFYTAPASTKYHDSCPEGLVSHSLRVYHRLIQEAELYCEQIIDHESLAIVGLFHDICKANYYIEATRNTKDENGKWIQVPYYTVDDMFPLGHGEKSVYLLQTEMRITLEEALAIRWHMGGFEPEGNYKYLNVAYNKTPLAVMLHIADMKATYL